MSLLRRRDDYYAVQRPGPTDAFLLIEVADTTLALDRSIKIPRYAAAGCPRCGWWTSSAISCSCSTDLHPMATPARAWFVVETISVHARSRTSASASTSLLAQPIGQPEGPVPEGRPRPCLRRG